MDNLLLRHYIKPVMKESLYYLFVSGLILGSGPCLGFCLPALTGFIAAYKPSAKKAFYAYLFFSAGRITGYIMLGALCGVFSGILKTGFFTYYLNLVNILLGFFVLLIGALTVIFKEPLTSRYCFFLRRGNLGNAGVLGLLAGFSPCLPLLGILNYIVAVSRSAAEGGVYALAFGLGTVLSPAIFIVLLSGKLSGFFLEGRARNFIRIGAGILLAVLGLRIIFTGLAGSAG
jgi:sulfite exporter TauE/SafE